jgi:putative phosphoribosyl transferase
MDDEIRIPAGRATLDGNLMMVDEAAALVLFVHGSGSSRHSPRNQFVARKLNDAGLATERLVHATNWAKRQKQTFDLPFGYFGSSTGGAAALVAAAELADDVGAVVSRGGRPDLAGDALPRVKAPTLLIVGGNDDVVIELNEKARAQMRCEVKLEIIPGATHLFEEPGRTDCHFERSRGIPKCKLKDNIAGSFDPESFRGSG